MKLTSLLLVCLLVIVACSPNAETTVDDAEPQTEVIENNAADADTQAADVEEETDTEMDASDDEAEDMTDSDESDMAMDNSEDMADSDEFDMAMDDSEDMTDSDESDMAMDDSDDMADSDESDMAMDDSDDMTEDDHSDSEMMDDSENMADSDESDMAMDDSDDMTEDDNTASAETEDTTAMIAYNGPDWTNLELVNARTGETFTFADFAGKTVFVEPMATWCTNCLSQQRRIKDVVGELSPDEFVIMSLSVETNLSAEDLAEYSTRHEFDWTFAVASNDLLTALVDEFGRSVSSPPSVPHFTITADGTAGNFTTGSKSGEDFLAYVRGAAS